MFLKNNNKRFFLSSCKNGYKTPFFAFFSGSPDREDPPDRETGSGHRALFEHPPYTDFEVVGWRADEFPGRTSLFHSFECKCNGWYYVWKMIWQRAQEAVKLTKDFFSLFLRHFSSSSHLRKFRGTGLVNNQNKYCYPHLYLSYWRYASVSKMSREALVIEAFSLRPEQQIWTFTGSQIHSPKGKKIVRPQNSSAHLSWAY